MHTFTISFFGRKYVTSSSAVFIAALLFVVTCFVASIAAIVTVYGWPTFFALAVSTVKLTVNDVEYALIKNNIVRSTIGYVVVISSFAAIIYHSLIV